jgi:2-dehydropantoate 2-reductase
MRIGPQSRITVAGAGSIGCYAGGCLALAGRSIRLLLRASLAEAIARHGLRISGLDGSDRLLPAQPAAASTGDAAGHGASATTGITADPAAAFAGADIILVTVKSGATAAMAELISRHAPAEAVIVSLQNGIGNVDALRAGAGAGQRVVAGMVPFNVVRSDGAGPPRFHRATSGSILIGTGVAGLSDALNVPLLPVRTRADMDAVLWGKLLVNLNNALNALSGLPLAAELADRRWRRLLAQQVDEALNVLGAARIVPAKIERVPPQMIPMILNLPDPIFRLIARGMLAIDPQARSSMWDDLQRGRTTEIDHLQGAILALARRHGVPAPMTQRIASLIKQAEAAGRGSPHLAPGAVAGEAAQAT